MKDATDNSTIDVFGGSDVVPSPAVADIKGTVTGASVVISMEDGGIYELCFNPDQMKQLISIAHGIADGGKLPLRLIDNKK